MFGKLKAINNPLTIIAIFAGLSEIAFTTSLGLVEKSLQNIFIWFVMGFPTLLIVLFFLTLNFNSKTLYSPSDYKNEENFVNAQNSSIKITSIIKQLIQQINELRQKIDQQSETQNKSIRLEKPDNFKEIIDAELIDINSRLNSVHLEADNIARSFAGFGNSQLNLQAKTLDLLKDSKTPLSKAQIASSLGVSDESARRILIGLVTQGLVIEHKTNSQDLYSLKQS